MKKSELYHLAQIAVVQSPQISPKTKLELIKILFEDERLAQFCEGKEQTNGV